MKGLDNWIMGINDPNAPFNQVDWEDYYAPVLDISQWVTDEMMDDAKTYETLGGVFDDAFTLLLERYNTRFNRKAIFLIMKDHAKELSDTCQSLYLERVDKK